MNIYTFSGLETKTVRPGTLCTNQEAPDSLYLKRYQVWVFISLHGFRRRVQHSSPTTTQNLGKKTGQEYDLSAIALKWKTPWKLVDSAWVLSLYCIWQVTDSGSLCACVRENNQEISTTVFYLIQFAASLLYAKYKKILCPVMAYFHTILNTLIQNDQLKLCYWWGRPPWVLYNSV